MKNYPEKGKLYRHKKGGLYQVIDMATHSEDLSIMVVYTCITTFNNTPGNGMIWVRPLNNWLEPGRFTLEEFHAN